MANILRQLVLAARNTNNYNISALLELTFQCDSRADLSAASQRKERKPEYQQIVAELDRLGVMSQYYTIEIGLLGHYLKETMKQILNQSFSHSKATLDRAAAFAITASQTIFFARSIPTWTN